jgi:PKHD-type hydroxylase
VKAPRIRPLDLEAARALDAEPAPRMAPVVEVPRVFDADQCARIVALHDTLGHDDARMPAKAQPKGGTDRAHAVDHDRRYSHVTHLVANDANRWIYERVIAATQNANQAAWGFDVAFMEPLQLLVYPVGGHIAWHTDVGDRGLTSRRKISATILLSAPEAYEGGVLEIMSGGRSIEPSRALGQAIFFPAYQNHRVTPVTAGSRAVLIVWTLGPRPLH